MGEGETMRKANKSGGTIPRFSITEEMSFDEIREVIKFISVGRK